MLQPDFLVIGAYKSGTTALHHYLRAHSEIFIPERKEPNYYAFAEESPPFDHPAAGQSVRSASDYERLFKTAHSGQKLGEVSPAYLSVPSARERILQLAPKAQLIAVLRNPIERAYSDYMMYRRMGRENEPSFINALLQQDARDSATDPTAHYLTTGLYFTQLLPYFECFSAEQLLVKTHEELSQDRESFMKEIFSFIGVNPNATIADQPPSNVSGIPEGQLLRLAFSVRNRFATQLAPIVPSSMKKRVNASMESRLTREEMSTQARQWLTDHYRSEITQLSELLHRDLSGWLE